MNKGIIRTLVGINISRMMTNKKGKNYSKSVTTIAFLYIGIAAVLMLTFSVMAIGIATNEGVPTWMYCSLGAVLAFVFMFIGSIFYTVSALYDAKDNDLLLSMPINPGAIITSRVLSVAVVNVFTGGVVLLPFAIVGLLFGKLGTADFLLYVVCSLLDILFTMSLTCLLAWIVAYVTSKVNNKNIVQIISLSIFMGIYFLYITQMNTFIENLVIAPEKAAAFFKALYPMYLMGTASAGDIVSLLLIIGITAILVIAAFALIRVSFIKVVAGNKIASAKQKKFNKTFFSQTKITSPVSALTRKDIAHFIGSPMYMFNAGSGFVFMVVTAVIMLVKSEDVNMLFNELGLPETLIYLVFMMGMLLMLSISCVSATSVSIEGKSLWIIKSCPISACNVLLAKARAHIIVSIPFLIATAVLYGIMTQSVLSGIVSLAILMIFTAFVAYVGVIINMLMPRFDFASEAQLVKQSGSLLVTMLIAAVGGIAVSVAMIPGFLFFSREIGLLFGLALTVIFAIVTRMMLITASAVRYDEYQI